jgi:hypothetical protein
VLVAAAALVIGAPGAEATQGQAVLAGAQNTAAYETMMVNTTQVSQQDCANANSFLDAGVMACGYWGVDALGVSLGVHGESAGGVGVSGDGKYVGVEGVATDGTGVGVTGISSAGTGMTAQSGASNGVGIKATSLSGSTAKAVWGVSDAGYGGYFTATGSVGYGLSAIGGKYGVRADGPVGTYSTGTTTGVEGSTSSGSGVYGHATSGIGVNAYANGGVALQVQGRAKFSRSGTVIVGAGTASKAVSLSGTTGNSMILAIAQQNANVFVKATVPGSNTFTIYLTGNAPSGGLKVAYFVLN